MFGSFYCEGVSRSVHAGWTGCPPQDGDSLPQLLQVDDGFFLASVLQFEVRSFSNQSQVGVGAGLRETNTKK